MTTRTLALPLAALTSLAILLAACGGPAATQAPGATSGTQTQAPVTQAPAGTDGAAPSLDLSSFHANADLESLFPDEIGGQTLTVLSMSGAEFMGDGSSSPELQATLTALGKSPSDLSVAFGGATNVTVIAFQIKGVDGGAILTELFKAYQQETEATITDVTISGKAVKKIVPTDTSEETSYIYTSQDVVFAVGGTAITDALLTETFSKLP